MSTEMRLLALLALPGCFLSQDKINESFPATSEADSAVEGTTPDTDEPTPIIDVDNDGVAAEDDCDDNDSARAPGLEEFCDGIDNDCDELVDGEQFVRGEMPGGLLGGGIAAATNGGNAWILVRAVGEARAYQIPFDAIRGEPDSLVAEVADMVFVAEPGLTPTWVDYGQLMGGDNVPDPVVGSDVADGGNGRIYINNGAGTTGEHVLAPSLDDGIVIIGRNIEKLTYPTTIELDTGPMLIASYGRSDGTCPGGGAYAFRAPVDDIPIAIDSGDALAAFPNDIPTDLADTWDPARCDRWVHDIDVAHIDGERWIFIGSDVDDNMHGRARLVSATTFLDNMVFYGDNNERNFGGTVLAGDLDGDGDDEIIVTAEGGAAFADGRVYIFDGEPIHPSRPLGPGISATDAALTYNVDGALVAAQAVGDVNGDGHLDLLLSATALGSGGLAFVVLGPIMDRSDGDLPQTSTEEIIVIEASVAGAHMGARELIDLDGDGLDEIIIGEERANAQAGQIRILECTGIPPE